MTKSDDLNFLLQNRIFFTFGEATYGHDKRYRSGFVSCWVDVKLSLQCLFLVCWPRVIEKLKPFSYERSCMGVMSDLDLLARKVKETDKSVTEVAKESSYSEDDIQWAYKQKYEIE